MSHIAALNHYAAAVTLGQINPAAGTAHEHVIVEFLFGTDEEVRDAAVIALGGREAVLSSGTTVGLLFDASNAADEFAEWFKLDNKSRAAVARVTRSCASVYRSASSRAADDGTDLTSTEPHEAALPSYDLGAGVNRADTGNDPFGIVGQTVIVPNRLWGSRLTGATPCRVSGFIGPYKFGKADQKPAYVIRATDDGFFYPVAADYLAKIMASKVALP